mmetsp:Transcript_76120/g.191605  ORF Transcript_76120/g.191605 Transcript_76120/m.191605 type:complete len:269 (+) Transcript_76120:406-1212(+)
MAPVRGCFSALDKSATPSRSEVEAALWHRSAEVEAARLAHAVARIGSIGLLLKREVHLQHPHRLLVHVLIGVLLKSLDALQPICLLHQRHYGVLSQTVLHLLRLADFEDVLKSIQGHANDLAVGYSQKVAHRFDAATFCQVLNLLRTASGRGVADDPRGLLLDVKVRSRKELDDGRNQTAVDNLLDLRAVPRGDVRDCPATLLANALLGVGQQLRQRRKQTALQDCLCLLIVTRNDVAHCTEGRSLYQRRLVGQELNEPLTHPSLEDR